MLRTALVLCLACKSPEEKALEALDAGQAALKRGDLDEAEKLFQQALEHDPGQPRAITGKATLLLERGDPVAALEVSSTCDQPTCLELNKQAYDAALTSLAAATPSAETARKEIRVRQLGDPKCGLVPMIDALPELRETDPARAEFATEALTSAIERLQVPVDETDAREIAAGYKMAKSAGGAAADGPCEEAEDLLFEAMSTVAGLRAHHGFSDSGLDDRPAQIFWGSFHKQRLAIATGTAEE